jgi:hypothetical protein
MNQHSPQTTILKHFALDTGGSVGYQLTQLSLMRHPD